METIVGIEGGLVGGGMDVIVVGEFCDGKPGGPVIMLRVDICSQNLLNSAVSDLRLAISLRVVGGGEIELGTERGEEGGPKLRGNAGITI
jgi:hypothetical protein